jgi:DNA polymerase-3 subunit alpha
MTNPFVHLHLHSEFSLADGIVRIKNLASRCAEFQQPAVALTDLSNFYGVVKFYRACLASGVKPVLGSDVWVESPLDSENHDRFTLLCKNNSGYRNLSKLMTDAYLRGPVKNRIVISQEGLSMLNEGLICIADDHEGPFVNPMFQAQESHIAALTAHYQGIFGDRFYLAISRTGRAAEQEYIAMAAQLANSLDIGLVATNRVVFLEESDFDAHEIRVCINEGKVLDDSRRSRNFTRQQYFRSTEEMRMLFEDLPAALDNAFEIAQRCNVFLSFDENYLPEYPDAGEQSEASLLRELTESGLAVRLHVEKIREDNGTPLIEQKYIDRLEMELGVIEKMGYPGYFLIVADFIKWSRENGIPVGPGRGSGAGSLVAWATRITELDPLPYGLIFERFLNPERVSLPDFDIDFCVEGRDRVIEYVAERYGHDQVAQIITFGTMAAKAVVRDVGRVMSFPYGFVDQIAKLVPFEVGMTLSKALNQEEQLQLRYEQDADVKQLIDSALQLEGIARNVGKHAGGVVIAPRPLTEYTPLYADTHLSQAITQLDKDDLEAIGLVKFDFLGLRTLTVIDSAVKMINQKRSLAGETLLHLDDIPLDDESTYAFVRSGQTTAIFQLESRGMKELIIKARPEVFEDLIALIAMFRPGPLQSGMVDDFVNRKAGRELVKYLHPDLESVLSTTYGVILYQEQVMKIAQVLAGYTLGGADLLRKAMGKKLPEEMAKQRQTFMEGSREQGIDKKIAESIFDLMDKFAGYGFNKSHSAAYALVSYQTAWLKNHYPAAFMAATLSADIDNTDKVVTLLADCKILCLSVLPPKINSSFYSFQPINETEITYGLGAVKGVGQGIIESIVAEREQNGIYKNLFEFCTRMDVRRVSKRVLEALIKSGAMDSLGSNRASLMAAIPSATQAAGQQQQDRLAGQFDMFGVQEVQLENDAVQKIEDWSDEYRLQAEKDTLGLYLTGHPYDRFSAELNVVSDHDAPASDLSKPKNGIFAGIMIAMRVINTRRGKMAFVTLDNAVHRVEVSLYSEKFTEYYDKLEKDSVVVAIGEFSADEYTGGCQLRAEKVMSIDDVRLESLVGLELELQEQKLDDCSLSLLETLLREYRGGKVTVSISYLKKSGEIGHLVLGNDWTISPDQNLFSQLEQAFGQQGVRYHYDSTTLLKYYPAKPAYRPKTAVNH